jgi:hypothetical protein
MWVLVRIGFAGLVFLFRALWRRQGIDQSVIYRDTRRLTAATYETTGDKGNRARVISTVSWGLALETPLVFSLSQESDWDRVSKLLGFASELETGDADFDRKVYVTCDEPALHRLLSENARVRQVIVGFLARGAVRVFSDGSGLWVEGTQPEYPSDRELAELYEVYVAVRDGGPARRRWWADSFLWKAVGIEALVWSVALYGAPAVLEKFHREFVGGEGQRHLNEWALVYPSLWLAAALLIGLMGLILVLMRGSSRGHRIVAESVAVLVFGLPSTAIEATSDFNIAFDRSEARVDDYRVVEKVDTHSGRARDGANNGSYYLKLEPVTEGAPEVEKKLRVAAGTFGQAQAGGLVRITSRAGRLKVPWIVRLEVVTVAPHQRLQR